MHYRWTERCWRRSPLLRRPTRHIILALFTVLLVIPVLYTLLCLWIIYITSRSFYSLTVWAYYKRRSTVPQTEQNCKPSFVSYHNSSRVLSNNASKLRYTLQDHTVNIVGQCITEYSNLVYEYILHNLTLDALPLCLTTNIWLALLLKGQFYEMNVYRTTN